MQKTHRSRWTLALGTTVAASLAAIGAAGLSTPASAVPPGGAVDRANGAKVKITPRVIPRGGTIRVTGWNWKAKGSRVQKGAAVTVKLDDKHIVAVIPIRKKRFSRTIRIPRQAGVGLHRLRFLAAAPATSVRSPRFRIVGKRVAKRAVVVGAGTTGR